MFMKLNKNGLPLQNPLLTGFYRRNGKKQKANVLHHAAKKFRISETLFKRQSHEKVWEIFIWGVSFGLN
jgi:hypothetical protein